MSSKYLHTTMADENSDRHKKLGCMNGLFQVFSRRHFFTSRRISSQSRKRLPSGESDNPRNECNSSTIQKATEKTLEGVKDRERTSIKSFISSSSSSSCLPTFSPVNKSTLLDQSILSHIAPKKQPDPSIQNSPRSPGIRNIVEYSIQRETCKLSVKTKAKPEGKIRVMKHVDSPRPQQVYNPVSARVSAHDRSSQVHSKERTSTLAPKDAPRFSCDERESREKRKSAAKFRELPKFSLDSSESLLRRAALEPRWNSQLEGPQQRKDQGLSCVVAKLMGLEAFPDSTDSDKFRSHENLHKISTSTSRKVDQNKHNQTSDSTGLAPRNALSPKLRKINSSAKPNRRFPLEPDSWTQKSRKQESQNSVVESQIEPQTLPPVYCQTEKRFTEVEFEKWGKDLKHLKKILVTKQKTGESREEIKDKSYYKQGPSEIGKNSTTPNIKGNASPKKIEASIATTRPAKVVKKPKITISSSLVTEGVTCLRELRTRENANIIKGFIPRKNQFRESSQESFRPMDKRSSTVTCRLEQTSVSPKMQHNKTRVDRQYNRIKQTPETRISKISVNRPQTDKFSPSSKVEPKVYLWQKGDQKQPSEISCKTRRLSHQEDDLSAPSESNINTTLKNVEVARNYQSEVAATLEEFGSESGTTPATLEQPSPVSVLDTTFCAEESPSPVEKISTAFTEMDHLSFNEAESYPVNRTRHDLFPDYNAENLKNIKHLNEKLPKAALYDEANADSIASLCDAIDPIHTYIAEILSAMGTFKDLGPSSTFNELHPLGRLINPSLFHILEQATSRIEIKDEEQSKGNINESKIQDKLHRKLIFDTTDEILVHILIYGFPDPCTSSRKLVLGCPMEKELLKKVYTQINDLQTNHKCSLSFDDDAIHVEIPGIALDIERMIFRDLIGEIVSDEASVPSQFNRHCRQLFTN